jgi:hypothetical protein
VDFSFDACITKFSYSSRKFSLDCLDTSYRWALSKFPWLAIVMDEMGYLEQVF